MLRKSVLKPGLIFSGRCKNIRSLGGGSHKHNENGHDDHGHGHHEHMMPPFARLPPNTTSIPTEVELVWDDGVAPETCVDFDAPSVDTKEMLKAMASAALFLFGVFGYCWYSDPEGSNPVAKRETVIPFGGLKRELGYEEEEEEEA